MYLDTHTKLGIEKSICEYISVEVQELHDLFWQIYSGNGDSVDKLIENFISIHSHEKEIDEILLFHFSRRLKDDNNEFVGNNLYDLLLTDTAVSRFLKEYDIVFKMGGEHLELFHKGKREMLESSYKGNIFNVKWRMGYFKGDEDYCFNGFAFKDLIYKNDYARSLYHGPEFIQQMLQVIDREDVLAEYIKNSKYYCLEYKIPLEKVIFDGCSDEMTVDEKAEKIVFESIRRLYDYYAIGDKYLYDHNNPCLRLKDSDTMENEYFIGKEEITADMLK